MKVATKIEQAIKLIEQYRAEIRKRADLMADGFCQGAWFEDTYRAMVREPNRAVNLSEGQRFGRLTVLSRSENDRHRKACWLCQCDCGNQTIVTGVKLRQGKTKSCGCYRKGQVLRRHAAEARRQAAAERYLAIHERVC